MAICYSHLLWVDEQVLWLDVSVNHVFAMAELDSLQQLVDKVADLVQFNSIRVLFKHLQQVLLDVFEHEIQAITSARESQKRANVSDHSLQQF